MYFTNDCIYDIIFLVFSTDTTLCPHHLSRSDLYEYGDLCLKVHYGNLDWETARQICLNEGGDLVQPRSPGMQEYIRVNLLPQVQKAEEDGFWIGATDIYSESHWRWVSGENSAWGSCYSSCLQSILMTISSTTIIEYVFEKINQNKHGLIKWNMA